MAVPIQVIVDGERVNAPTINRPLGQLASAVNQVKQQVSDLSLTGARLILENQTLDASVAIYDVVYWDGANGKFKKALAALEISGSDNTYFAGISSFASGIVVRRDSTTGTILLLGYYPLDTGIAAAMLEEGVTLTPGRGYYLSRNTAGKLTDIPGAISVFVGELDTDFIIFHPVVKDLAESHTHLRFSLAAQPLGSNVDLGGGLLSVGGFISTSNPGNSARMIAADGVAGGGWTHSKYIDYRFTVTDAGATKKMLVERKEEGASSFSTVLTDQIVLGTFIDIESYGLKVKFTFIAGMVLNQTWLIRAPRDLKGWAVVDTGTDITAPEDAFFRYNIEADQDLVGFFPILDASQPAITMNGVELQRDTGFYRITPNSIYWMTQDFDKVPWPQDWVSYADPGSPEFLVLLNLYLTKFNIQGEPQVVTSLTGSGPVTVVDCQTGLPAKFGDLRVQLETDAQLIDDPLTAGDLVFKGFEDGSLLQVKVGAVVEKLKAGAGILLTATRAAAGDYQGTVTVQLASDLQFAGPVSDITLQNAKQEIRGLTSITMLEPPPLKTAFLGKIRVSTAAVDPSKMSFRAVLAGSLANSSGSVRTVRLKLSRVNLADAPGDLIPTVAASSSNLDFSIPNGYVAYTLFEKTIGPVGSGADFEIDMATTPGDVFCFQISRETVGAGTTYAGNVGFVALDFLIS